MFATIIVVSYTFYFGIVWYTSRTVSPLEGTRLTNIADFPHLCPLDGASTKPPALIMAALARSAQPSALIAYFVSSRRLGRFQTWY